MAKFTSADIVIGAKDKTKPGITSAKKGVGGLTSAVKSYGAEMAAVYLIVRQVASAMIQLSKEAAYLKQINMAFESMAEAAGESSTEMLDAMRELSGGTISTMEMIQSANRAMVLGLPIDKLDDMMRIARASATATGESVKKMFDDIVIGIGRQSRMILDNLGIIVDTEKANQDYAEAMGIVGRELTDTEKKQAFMNATLEAGEEIIKKVGKAGQEITSAERWQIMTAAVADLRVEMGMRLLPAFEGITIVIAEYARKLANAMEATRKLREIMKEINEGNIEQVKSIADLNTAYNAEFQAVMDINAQIKKLKTSKEGHVGINAILIDQLEKDKQGHLETAKAIEIESEKRRIKGALLSEINRKEKEAIDLQIEQEEARKANAASVAEFHTILNAAYAGTERGAIEAMEAQIEYLESMLLVEGILPKTAEKLEYIIELHKEELEVLKEVANVYVEKYIDPMMEAEENWAQASAIHYYAWLEQQKKMREEAKKTAEEIRQAFEDMAIVAMMYYDVIDSASAMSFQNRKTELNDWYQTKKAELEAEYTDENELADAMAKLDDDMAEKSRQLKIDQARAEKKMAMLGIVVNTAMAVSKIWGQTGIFGIAAQWPAIAMGIAQLAIVKAQKIPAFQYGGIIGSGYGGGDKKLIMGEEGEMVIRKEVVRENRPALEAMNAGEGVTIHNHIYMDGDQILEFISKATVDGRLPIHEDAVGAF